MTKESASEPSLVSRSQTDSNPECGAGFSGSVWRQHPVATVGDRSNGPRNITSNSCISYGTGNYSPRFLLIKRTDGSFLNVSPFEISKGIYSQLGEVKNIKKMQDLILIETKSNAQSQRALKMTQLTNFQVEVAPHRTLNVSKGVISCADLLNCSLQEIEEELKPSGVLAVSRIRKKKNGVLVDTAAHILTFNSPELPKKVKVAFYSLEVRPYFPEPLRCFRCQKFGHTTAKCSITDSICICGKSKHEGTQCSRPAQCVNCGGDHFTIYKKCPAYVRELAIQKIKTSERLSYTEAKKRYTSTTPNQSYAQATAKNISMPPTTDLIKELEPILISTISKLLNRYFHPTSTQMQVQHPPPMTTSETPQPHFTQPPLKQQMLATPSQTSLYASTDSVNSLSKRKRTTRSECESKSDYDFSESDALTSVIDKKPPHRKSKRGRPKGIPRNSKYTAKDKSQQSPQPGPFETPMT